MTTDPHDSGADRPADDGNDFSRQADEKEPGLVAELMAFMRENRKWWLAPVIIVLLAFGLLLILGSTGAAPFIYTLF